MTEEELNDIAKTMKSSRLLKRFIIDNSEDDFIIKGLAAELVADRDVEEKYLILLMKV